MQKRMLISFIVGCMLLSSALVSANLSIIEKHDRGSVVIAELDNPASFELILANMDASEDAEIYTLTGISMTPRGAFEIPNGNSALQIQAFLPASARRITGQYVFEYQIKATLSGILKDTLTVTIVPLKETLSLEPTSFKPSSKNVRMIIKNRQNTLIKDLKIKLSSEFFTLEESLTLEPYESTTITIPIDRKKAETLTAGKYIVKGELGLEDARATIEGVIDYLEEKDIVITTYASGFLVRQKTITRTNEGNIHISDTIDGSRDVLTRLFTAYSREPITATRHTLYVSYLWQKELAPGESWTLSTTTNYTFPFILLLLIVASAFLAHRYSRTQVIAQKKVTHVRTKSGQFAVKVQISVHGRTDVKNIQVIDRLPGMTKIYEKFGTRPDKLDATTRRIFWNIDHLRAGEERVISYIIYSTVSIVGRLELPPALVVFEHNGALHEVPTNRAFFLAENAHFTL